MKHELNAELCDLGKSYQGGHISLDKYRTERRAVIDKLTQKPAMPAKKKSSKLGILVVITGVFFLLAYWLL